MTKRMNPTEMLLSAMMEEIRLLRSEVADLKSAKYVEPKRLTTFAGTLEDAISARFPQHNTFLSPSGKPAASLHDLHHVLGFTPVQKTRFWNIAAKCQKADPINTFERHFEGRSQATVCIVLAHVETILSAAIPRLAPKKIKEFKEANGVRP